MSKSHDAYQVTRRLDYIDEATYDRRRKVVAGIAAAVLTTGGMAIEHTLEPIGNTVGKIKEHFASPFEKYGCEITDNPVRIGQGGTVWQDHSVPLANELGVTIDTAQSILNSANPGVNLGDIDASTPPINTVVCDPSKPFEN